MVQVTKFSKLPKLEGLEIIEGDAPSPQDGEVLCQITLRPVNPTDVHAIQGLRPKAGAHFAVCQGFVLPSIVCAHENAITETFTYGAIRNRSHQLYSEKQVCDPSVLITPLTSPAVKVSMLNPTCVSSHCCGKQRSGTLCAHSLKCSSASHGG